LATESVPKSIGGNNHGLTAYATVELVQILKDGARECALRPSGAYQPSSVAISPDGGWLAVGSEEQKVYIYPLTNGQLSDSAAVDPIKSAALILESNRGSITALAFSPDGSRLAVADADRKVLVYAVPSGELQITQWVFHSARVNCVNWSPSGQHVVSGGLDRDIYVWSIERPTKYIAIKNVHQGGVSGVSFVDDSTILSVGNDSTLKTFALNY
jgi:WD40 repeat protein